MSDTFTVAYKMLFQLRQLNFQLIRSHRVALLASKLNRQEEVLTLCSNEFFIRHLELRQETGRREYGLKKFFFRVFTKNSKHTRFWAQFKTVCICTHSRAIIFWSSHKKAKLRVNQNKNKNVPLFPWVI